MKGRGYGKGGRGYDEGEGLGNYGVASLVLSGSPSHKHSIVATVLL